MDVLEEVAQEIPVRLDGPERQEKIKTIIIECHKSGKSWIVVENNRVIGFVLARPDAYKGQAAIALMYGGVRADLRRRGIFFTLMEKLKSNDVPLIANVLRGNLSSMVDSLGKVGFTKLDLEFDALQTRMVWSPAVDGKGGGQWPPDHKSIA